jgi:hypothetical protein
MRGNAGRETTFYESDYSEVALPSKLLFLMSPISKFTVHDGHVAVIARADMGSRLADLVSAGSLGGRQRRVGRSEQRGFVVAVLRKPRDARREGPADVGAVG